MILIPDLSVTQSRDGESFIFADGTLEDNQSNSTNYWNGVTTRYNTNISLSTVHATKPDKIDDVTLYITKPDETQYDFLSFDVPVTALNYTISNTDIGETGIIPDGVYSFEYILWNLVTGLDVSGTISTQTITFVALPPSLEVGQYIKFAIGDTTLYTVTDIDSVTKIVTLDQNLEATYANATELYIGYRYLKYFLFDFNANCCIDKAIATAATSCCDCVSDELTAAANMYILLLGARAQVNNGLQVEAQATIDALGSLCAGDEINCSNCN